MELESALWRLATHHLELGSFVTAVAPLLTDAGATCLVVWRCDAPNRRLLYAAGDDHDQAEPLGHLALDEEAWRSLHAWLEANRPGPLTLPALVDVLAAPPLNHTLALPLVAGATTGFALISLAAPSAPRWLPTLHEALTAALHNDARLRELSQLREAAEADRQALLTRLERDSIADSIVGTDSGLRHVMALVEQVSVGNTPVLILGETGSGKEVIARAIHTRSTRSRGPMVRVNCGAIPPSLIDSELFGHEKGAFTGALAQRKGWFERADGGTLLLDEVGELPAEAQVRLLRVLQDGAFSRVGGHRTLTVDVRVVAATHRDLEAMVAAGTFREDLWYRLSIFPLRIPALRERREDILPMARFFAARTGRRLGGVPLDIPQDAIDILLRYDWPGNARELAAVIERAAVLGGGRELRVEAALGMNTRAARANPAPRNAPPLPSAPDAQRPTGTLRDAMRLRIEDALAATGGVIEGPEGAAALLDIHPSTLRSRMKKLGLEWDHFRRP